MPLKNRKYPRLKNKEIYSTPGMVAHIIIGALNKKPYFKKHECADAIIKIIIETAKEKSNKLYAYCVMPDHIHILTESSESCSIIDYVRLVKGRFSAHCRDAGWNIRLQRSFYDHMVRKNEDVEELSRYILGNPVRAGIESSFGKYPFAGSMVFNLKTDGM